LEGQTCLLSGGAPDSPVHHRTVTVTVRCAISFLFWCIRPLVLGVGWRTRHSPMCPTDRCCGPRVTRGLRGRPLALATVGSPDSPVNYSRTLSSNPESGEFTRTGLGTGRPVHHRTVRCAKPNWSLLHIANSFFQFFSHYF
jgi:hypothetical protein